MERKPDHPDEPVYRVRQAPSVIDGHNFGRALAAGRSRPEDRTWELVITDDRYLAWNDLDDDVPTVTVPCHMLGYGPEISAVSGEGLHTQMRFRALPDMDHDLDLPDPFWIMAEDYKDHEPTNGFVYAATPQFGL